VKNKKEIKLILLRNFTSIFGIFFAKRYSNMALAKQKLREIILQILYSKNFMESENDSIVSFMMRQIKTTKKNILSALAYTNKIFDNIDKLDEKIKKAATSYEINRISKVELCILRLSLFEIEYDENIPFKVAISEAIRLTKKFANMQSVGFINAILDCVYNKQNEDSKK